MVLGFEYSLVRLLPLPCSIRLTDTRHHLLGRHESSTAGGDHLQTVAKILDVSYPRCG